MLAKSGKMAIFFCNTILPLFLVDTTFATKKQQDMETKVMRIEYCKQVDSGTAPWLSLTNVDELQWNGVYSLRVSNDDGSHNLPFRLRDDETVTFVVKDHSHPGMLQGSRTIVQEITHVDRATGSVSNYSRHCSNANGKPTWSKWTSDEKNVITWNQESHIDMFTTAGIYNIIGERTNAGDGLPFANSNPGHSFHARLVVLDSSINGTEVCITQILMLSNRVGGDGNVYLRTGNAASKEELQSGNSWDLWGTLQQNIEVGQTTSLDDYIDNGVYSGVYMVSPTQLETFVLVVINNYALAASMGEVRNISQFKYALNINGNFSYKTRTGRGEDEMDWGSWVDLGAATTTDIQDGVITAQKLSADVRKKVENPLRPLYIAAGAEYNESTGNYELNGITDLTESDMIYIYEYKNYHFSLNTARYFQENKNVRTIFPMNTVNTVYDQLFKNNKLSLTSVLMNSNLEVIKFSKSQTLEHTKGIPTESGSMASMFTNAKKLKTVYPIDVSAVTSIGASFDGTIALIDVRLCGLKCSAIFKDSTNISKESVLYMMQYALPTSAIAITLHPDAYARLADDTDIVAALEAQPLVSLVSA